MEKFEFKLHHPEISPEKISRLEKIRKSVEETRDALGLPVDEKIKEAVIMCNAIGLTTSASCEGHIDHGIPVPWIEIAAPNEPEEKYVGQKEIFEKVAKKYGIEGRGT
jgi:3-mercaptopyruvate sulfurtransferase SseA